MSIADEIRSISQVASQDYTRPDPKKVEQFIEDLQSNTEAKDYLKVQRGFTEETLTHFKVGYDKSKDAIAIPVYKDKELINIKYRFLKPDKIRYTSERNAETWLYYEEGIEEAKKKGGVLIVEGEMDLMSVWQAGITNVVSVASGKDSYGVWIELLDRIPKVYIAFDNDEGGRTSSKKFAERIGLDKSFEIIYPEGIKDANEYFNKHDKTEFVKLINSSHPFYTHQFKSVGDIIETIKNGEEETLESKWIPNVRIEKDWLLVLSGDTNVGKTTFCMNLARDFAERDIPTLILPFERGVVSVGKRFLQVAFEKSAEDMTFTSREDWERLTDKATRLPVYFATPKKNDTVETIRKARRFFDTRVVIIDHLDYIIRHTGGNRENEISNTLQDYKRLAEELKVVFIVVTHLRKREGGRPGMMDLKGSSSLSQDPECVVLLSSEEDGVVTVDVAKNKGHMGVYEFGVNLHNGVMNQDPNDF